MEIRVHAKEQAAIDRLSPHCAFFTWGENYGNQDCRVPLPKGVHFRPTRQPVVMDLWERDGRSAGDALTTVGNWRQRIREVEFEGEIYYWSKHYEFLKFIDLPSYTTQPFELALSRYNADEQMMLESKGWRVVPARTFSRDIDDYQRYVVSSRGEFTVAKDQNVRLRSGWFSDRSATYLAAGRPVITQETGFSNILPTGAGLFAFSTLEEIVGAVDAVNRDDRRHRERAFEVAREYFDHRRVLGELLDRVGVQVPRGRAAAARGNGRAPAPIPAELVLEPVSRRPLTLPGDTVRAVLERPVPTVEPSTTGGGTVETSVVVVTFEN